MTVPHNMCLPCHLKNTPYIQAGCRTAATHRRTLISFTSTLAATPLLSRRTPVTLEAELQAAEHDLAEVEGMDCAALRDALQRWNVQSNEPGGGKISEPFPFNLMFQTSIGPSGTQVGYLRPETAQGIFVNFRDLLYYNGGRLPFAAAQIGQSFRNEINPKQGLLRVREFTQAEIEHFVHPERKAHPRFKDIADVAPLMHSAALQQAHAKPEALSLRDAVAAGVVANETLAYFIGRTYLFMVAAGINPKRMIFRQHLPNEMAHYACGAPGPDPSTGCPALWPRMSGPA